MSNTFTPELVFVSGYFELGETDPRFHGSRQFGSDHVMILIPPHLGPMTNLRRRRMGIFRWAEWNGGKKWTRKTALPRGESAIVVGGGGLGCWGGGRDICQVKGPPTQPSHIFQQSMTLILTGTNKTNLIIERCRGNIFLKKIMAHIFCPFCWRETAGRGCLPACLLGMPLLLRTKPTEPVFLGGAYMGTGDGGRSDLQRGPNGKKNDLARGYNRIRVVGNTQKWGRVLVGSYVDTRVILTMAIRILRKRQWKEAKRQSSKIHKIVNRSLSGKKRD